MKKLLCSIVLSSILCVLASCGQSAPPVDTLDADVDYPKSGMAGELYQYVDEMLKTPHYSITYTSDTEYNVTSYNSRGESVTEYTEQDVTVFLKNGTGVHITQSGIVVRPDVDNLVYVREALRLVVSDKAKIVSYGTEPNEEQHLIVIEGRDCAYEYYSELLGVEEADTIFSTVEGDEISLVFAFVRDTESDGWFIDYSIDVDGTVTTMWVIVDCKDMNDWSIGNNDWYDYDFSDESLNATMIRDMRENLSVVLLESMTG